MKMFRFGLLVGGLLLTLGGAQALGAGAPATVKVHVEGGTATLLPTTVVTTTTTPVGTDGNPSDTCSGTSALGALDTATKHQWSGTFSAANGGYFVATILGETPDPSFAFWNFYVNGISQNSGACGVELQNGDDVLFFNSCFGSGSPCYTGEPLELTAPNTAVPGTSFTVHVTQSTTTFGGPPDFLSTTALTPAAGATVSGGSAPAATNAAGDATVTLSAGGPATLRVTSSPSVPDEATICATTGSDGFCGTALPGQPTTTTAPATAPVTAPVTAPGTGPITAQSVPDHTPPVATIASIANAKTFAKGHGPRTLSGTAADTGSGVGHVSLRLERTFKGHCSTFLPTKAKFSGIHCGASNGVWFKVSTTTSWSYLLPAALASGRYTLDVRVTDHVGNYTTALVPGQEHVAFTVG
jgi:uncharacterized protein DUF4430